MGYTWEGMKQIEPREALERFNNNLQVFRLNDDGSESLVEKAKQIVGGALYGYENEANKTIVYFEDKKITLTQEPYIDGIPGERPWYLAHGTDQFGNDVLVSWDVVDGWEEIEDEAMMCDWENPVTARKL